MWLDKGAGRTSFNAKPTIAAIIFTRDLIVFEFQISNNTPDKEK